MSVRRVSGKLEDKSSCRQRRAERCAKQEGQRTLDNQVRAEDTHGGNTNAGLGSAVGGTETRKDDG